MYTDNTQNEIYCILTTEHTQNLLDSGKNFVFTDNARKEFVLTRVDTKWCFQFFAKYDYRFLSDVIIAIITTFFA
jgi:hypothetical protein